MLERILLFLKNTTIHFWKFGELSKLKQVQVVLICHDADRGYVYNGKRYSQYLDTINEQLRKRGLSTLTIAYPYSRFYGNKAYGNVISINGLYSRFRLIKFLFFIVGFKNKADKYLIGLWRKIFVNTAPKVIIAIQPEVPEILAANSLNIPINDLQHGVISGEGYYGMNYRSEVNQQGWPDCVLTWNDSSSMWVNKNIPWLKAKTIGNPWVNRFRYPDSNDHLVLNTLNEMPFKKEDKPNILVTSQWHSPVNPEKYEFGVSETLLEYIKSTLNKYNWMYRLHPQQNSGNGRAVFQNYYDQNFSQSTNFDFKKSTQSALPALLRVTDLHITMSSAVTKEASQFGIPTCLLSSQSSVQEWFKEDIENGNATLVACTQLEIDAWIDSAIRKERNTNSGSNYNIMLEKFYDDVVDQCAGE